MPVKKLSLQTRYEGVADRIIQSRSCPSHRRDYPSFLQPLAEREGRVLRPSVGVVDQSNPGLPSAEGHLKSIYHNFCPQVVIAIDQPTPFRE